MEQRAWHRAHRDSRHSSECWDCRLPAGGLGCVSHSPVTGDIAGNSRKFLPEIAVGFGQGFQRADSDIDGDRRGNRYR